jgi:hypothetical protein
MSKWIVGAAAFGLTLFGLLCFSYLVSKALQP